MSRLVREWSRYMSFSLSSVIQLIAVNLVAIIDYDEKSSRIQDTGASLAVVAVMLITLGTVLVGK